VVGQLVVGEKPAGGYVGSHVLSSFLSFRSRWLGPPGPGLTVALPVPRRACGRHWSVHWPRQSVCRTIGGGGHCTQPEDVLGQYVSVSTSAEPARIRALSSVEQSGGPCGS
jgi:hypothetical protein